MHDAQRLGGEGAKVGRMNVARKKDTIVNVIYLLSGPFNQSVKSDKKAQKTKEGGFFGGALGKFNLPCE